MRSKSKSLKIEIITKDVYRYFIYSNKDLISIYGIMIVFTSGGTIIHSYFQFFIQFKQNFIIVSINSIYSNQALCQNFKHPKQIRIYSYLMSTLQNMFFKYHTFIVVSIYFYHFLCFSLRKEDYYYKLYFKKPQLQRKIKSFDLIITIYTVFRTKKQKHYWMTISRHNPPCENLIVRITYFG